MQAATAPSLLTQLKQLFFCVESAPGQSTNKYFRENKPDLLTGSPNAQLETADTHMHAGAPNWSSASPLAGNLISSLISCSSTATSQDGSGILAALQAAGASGLASGSSTERLPSPIPIAGAASRSRHSFNTFITAGQPTCILVSPQAPDCGDGQLLLLQKPQQEPEQHLQQDGHCSGSRSSSSSSSRHPATIVGMASLNPSQQTSQQDRTHAFGNLISRASWRPLLLSLGCRSGSGTEVAPTFLQEPPSGTFSAERLQPQLAPAPVCPATPTNCTSGSETVFPIYAGSAAACSLAGEAVASVGSVQPPAAPSWRTSEGASIACSAPVAAVGAYGRRLDGGPHAQGRNLNPLSVFLNDVCPDTLLAEWQAQDDDDEVSSPTGRTLMELQDEQGLLRQQQLAEIGSQWLEPDSWGTWQGALGDEAVSDDHEQFSSSAVPTATPTPTAQVQSVLRLSVLGPIMQVVAVHEVQLAGNSDTLRQPLVAPAAQTQSSWFTDEWPEHADSSAVDEYGRAVHVYMPGRMVVRGPAGNRGPAGQQGLGHRHDETHGGMFIEDSGVAGVAVGVCEGMHTAFTPLLQSPSKNNVYNGWQVPRSATG